MSKAQQATLSGGTQQIDPYGIVPESFLAEWGAETIREGMRKAEAAPSSTDQTTMRRCPECKSTSVIHKPGTDIEHKREESQKCTDCGAHFDDAAPPKQEAMPGERTTLDQIGANQ